MPSDAGTLQEHVRKKIAARRKAIGVQQKDVANLIGVSRIGYQKLEYGKTQLTIHYVQQISRCLGMHYLDLMEGYREPVSDEVSELKLDITQPSSMSPGGLTGSSGGHSAAG